MNLELLIASAAAVLVIGLYAVVRSYGANRALSDFAGASNIVLALAIAAIGLAHGLGLQVSVSLLFNPHNWVARSAN